MKLRRRNIYHILTLVLIGLLCCNCNFRLKGWFVVPNSKNAKQYTWENISVDKNMDIRVKIWASIINTGSYVSNETDSIDVTLQIYVFASQNYIPAPKVKIDEFTLIDIDKNDTLQVAYIRFNGENLKSFSEITPALQEWARNDSIKAAEEGFWRERGYYERSYVIDIRTNKQLKDVKNLLLNLQLSINDNQYKMMNYKYRVKEGHTWIFPH